MKKLNKTLVIDFVLFGLFTLIMFAAPFAKNINFWMAYIFSSVAIFSQIYYLKIAFQDGSDVKSKFYGFPIARISVNYLVAQLLVGLLFTIISSVFNDLNITWIALIVYSLLLAYVLVGTITADGVRDEIIRQEEKIKATVQVMKNIQCKISPILEMCDESNKKDVANLIEDIKYSDPVSSLESEIIEHQLEGIIDDIRNAIIDVKTEDVSKLCKKASVLLIERNQICKLNK